MNFSWRPVGRADLPIAHGSWEILGDRKNGYSENPPAGNRAKAAGRDWGLPFKMLYSSGNDADKAHFSCPGPRSRPLHRGRAAACRTGLRAAGTEIHADSPPRAASPAVEPPAAWRL